MGVGDARQRDSRAGRAGRPTFDLVTSKLRHPALRAGTVPRSSLIERLASGDPRPVVSVVAPAGYGKTTLLGVSALTAAELRLLPLLTTHLSFPEIAQELSLSPHTVKSEAVSIYRKLGASSRSQMIAQCRELGLLEG
jgi:ATP/maltotriose-dependent transcriptional regulator MalT